MATVAKLILGLLALLVMVNSLPLEGHQEDLALNKGLPHDENDPVGLREEMTKDDESERSWCCSGFEKKKKRGRGSWGFSSGF